ncbi:MAG: DoxX family membrane protein [Corynebacterium sp.]|nr:DoxX family membrane protein [Corynebacterium sp.]
MTDNPKRPIDDLDDVDVPTYGGEKNPTQRAYERAGRVAPTVISPNSKPADAKAETAKAESAPADSAKADSSAAATNKVEAASAEAGSGAQNSEAQAAATAAEQPSAPKPADEAFEMVDAPTTQFGVASTTPGGTAPAAPQETAPEAATTVIPAVPADQAAAAQNAGVQDAAAQNAEQSTIIFRDQMPPVENPTEQIPPVAAAPGQDPFQQAQQDLYQQEPFQQAAPAAPMNVALPGSMPQQVAPPAPTIVEERRGTIDFGIFLLRLIVGGVFTARAVFVLFGIGGSTGLTGLQEQFNFANTTLMPIILPSLQLIAGVFLILGLATPVASAIGIVAASIALVQEYIYFDGIGNDLTLTALLLGLVVALHFTGPGKASFDYSRSWAKRPLASVWIFFFLAIIAAVGLWVGTVGVNPLAV